MSTAEFTCTYGFLRDGLTEICGAPACFYYIKGGDYPHAICRCDEHLCNDGYISKLYKFSTIDEYLVYHVMDA